jgi:hypothetical protein
VAAAAAAARPSPALYVVAIALSAFLMFTIELLAGRLVLPVFGGSPAVWTTALVVFTGLLFIGYLYAHVVATYLTPRRGGIVHLAVVAAGLGLTLLAPQDVAALRVAGSPEALNVLYALLVLAGAPIFLLATSTPLLSSWFAGRGGDPWWLYAVSNGASFLALVAYPFLIEPFIPLSAQRTLVAAGLVLYAAGVAAVVATARRSAPRPTSDAEASSSPIDAPRGGRQLRWLLAACIPAGLLSATTNYIAIDLVSAPLLWIGPLGIYLASFVIAFSRSGRRLLPFVEFLVPAAVTLLWIPFVLHAYLPVAALLLVEFGSFAVLAIAIHGRLALDRPDERFLTRFYLILSAGGLIATGFVALVAPVVFSWIYEYPILLVAGVGVLALLPGPGERVASGEAAERVMAPTDAPTDRGLVRGAILRLIPFAVVGVALLALVAGGSDVAGRVAILLAAGAIIIVLARTPALLAGGTAIAIVILMVGLAPPYVTRVRTFFGVIEVRLPGGPAYAEYSGQTLHGAQFTDGRSREPTTYYVREGPLGSVFDDLRARTHSASIGVVGLGAGTIAAYTQPDDSITYFEIDGAVVDLAEQGPWFTYLRDSAAKPKIVMGDARLSLEDQPDASFDLLVLDAFSSDAVPAHLLTREAMEMYMQKLRPGGVLAYHLTNRYYDLPAAVTATATSARLEALDRQYVPDEARTAQIAAYASEWVVVGAPSDVQRFASRGWRPARPGPVLTDDFSDLLRVLRSPW